MEISESQIIKWLDEIQSPHTALTESQRPLQTHFVIQTGQKPRVLIYQHSKVPNRLIFQIEILFADQHRKILSEKPKADFNRVIVGWTDKLTTYDVNWKFDAKGQEISKLSIHKFIDKSELTANSFFQTLARIEIVGNQMMRNIGISLNVEPQGSFSSSPGEQASSDHGTIYG